METPSKRPSSRPSSSNKLLDKHTFGSSQPAVFLVDVLNRGNPKLASKVCRLLAVSNFHLDEINRLAFDHYRRRYLNYLSFRWTLRNCDCGHVYAFHDRYHRRDRRR